MMASQDLANLSRVTVQTSNMETFIEDYNSSTLQGPCICNDYITGYTTSIGGGEGQWGGGEEGLQHSLHG